MMYCFSTFAKTLRRYVKNISITDERFVDDVLKPYAEAVGLITPRGKEFYFDKSRASELLNGRRDIPKKFRRGLDRFGLDQTIEPAVTCFIEEDISQSRLKALEKDLTHLVETSENLSREGKAHLLERKDNLPAFVSRCLLMAIEQCNLVERSKPLLRNGSYQVDAIVDDIFKYGLKKRAKAKRIVVIPVNTHFSTSLTENFEGESRPLVSANTIHGKLLLKWKQSHLALDDLAIRVKKDLAMRYGEASRYPIGSVAVIEQNSVAFYLLAISEFDENNAAHASKENILDAINQLISFYDRNGQGYEMYVPLMGTGRSRANLSLQEAFDAMLAIFEERINDVHGNIHIVIYPNDANEVSMRQEGDVDDDV